MKPIDAIRAAYADGPFIDTFDLDIRLHRRLGFVLEDESCFIAWRRCDLKWGFDLLRDPEQVSKTGELAWVWAASGDIRKAARVAFELSPWAQWVGFDRRGAPRLLDAESLKRRLSIDRPFTSC